MKNQLDNQIELKTKAQNNRKQQITPVDLIKK